MERRFFKELDRINVELIKMGGFCEEGLRHVEKILFDDELDEIADLKSIEKKVDRLETDIENSCQRLILLEQPVAQDLRQIYGTIKIINDLERISDQTLSIGFLADGVENLLPEFKQLFNKIREMVTLSIDGYTKASEQLAQKTIAQDQQVNELFAIIKEKLAQSIPDNLESSLNQLMIAKYMEGIGDHAKNVANVTLQQLINPNA
ncbi:MAG: hypothetical protein LKF42_07955 [Streptococcaceae bacterium]|jgi:phosphate transport system protein|nr:hypothetical protein [Streptococcaceae bacterium]MCH4177629.1 hypothetical protein [Streptococcaceae bacterium]